VRRNKERRLMSESGQKRRGPCRLNVSGLHESGHARAIYEYTPLVCEGSKNVYSFNVRC
jgi:hypothetical protein